MVAIAFRATCALILTLPLLPGGESPWPAEVEGFAPPAPGEHPRLFFRESDLPALREKAETEEGRAILARLREQLDGGDGTSPPPEGMWTISHVAGYGFLYQITGDERYAEAGKAAMEQSLDGVKHREEKRYGFRNPKGALRAGPSLGWHALGYDLCYDGWDEAFRNRVRDALMNYDEGKNMSLAELAVGSRHGPHSNHWGMQIGGAALTLLVLRGDHGVDNRKIESLMAKNRECFIRKLTEGYGDGNYFGIGFGLFDEDEKAAWLWFYERFLQERDREAGTPYDTCSYYPHHSVLSFVNWPVGLEPVDPDEVMPHASIGTTYGYCMFRNRWEDEQDLVVSFLARRPRGHTKKHEIGDVWYTARGEQGRWGEITGEVRHAIVAEDGSAVVRTADGCIAVDFSGASGAPGMLALLGAGAPEQGSVELDGTRVALKFLGTDADPEARVEGGKIVVGEQRVGLEDGRLVLAEFADARTAVE